MENARRSFDWHLPVIWVALLGVSAIARTYVDVADQARTARPIGFGEALAIEVSSHLTVAALLPVLYWMHRHWPISGPGRNLAIHAAAVVPFSIAHTLGMAALRLALDRFSPPAVPEPVQEPPPPDARSAALPERFAVRKRGKEILVEVADIDWIEASGNYAVLHVGGDRLEIRSSLTRLESELDAKRFVRVHKSYVVNVARIAEVTPWVSGDWRIRLQDGAEINLSRRYRSRFEALVPVKS
jgi:hypothetical protein